jgi:predicted PurR-regulated permease PerM
LIEQLDLHFLEPHIIGQKQYLSNFGILLSVIIMGRAFGIFGCFLGVPTFSVIGIVYQSWLDKKAKALNYKSKSEQEKSDMETAPPAAETASCEQDL